MNIETANRLYELRKKKGLSQEELAECLGVSRQAVSKWERSEASPDTDNLIALAKIYGLTLDELIYGERENSKTDKACVDAPVSASFKGEDKDHTFKAEIEVDVGHNHKRNFWLEAPYAIICVIVYLICGFYDIFGGWILSWIIFITIPVYYSAVEAIFYKRLSMFSYPVLCTVVYLYLGMYHGNWHPSWLLFLTIPIFVPLADTVDGKLREKGIGMDKPDDDDDDDDGDDDGDDGE